TGYPKPSLSLDRFLSLPDGLTFTDKHDGTATISGTFLPGIWGCQHVSTDPAAPPPPCGIIASNSQCTVEQQFVIYSNAAPRAFVAPPTSATFIAGIPNQVELSAAGGSTPVRSWNFRPNGDAPWLSFRSNIFNIRTATLSGTPPVGTTGSFTVGVAPYA